MAGLIAPPTTSASVRILLTNFPVSFISPSIHALRYAKGKDGGVRNPETEQIGASAFFGEIRVRFSWPEQTRRMMEN
jgi:hypothetical protein